MSKDNFSTPEGIAKVIHLQSDKSSSLLEFAIVHDDALDSEKFIVGSKPNKHGLVVFRHRNISRGNTKSLYGYIDDFISCLEELVLQKSLNLLLPRRIILLCRRIIFLRLKA
jgi:hypothetical protein